MKHDTLDEIVQVRTPDRITHPLRRPAPAFPAALLDEVKALVTYTAPANDPAETEQLLAEYDAKIATTAVGTRLTAVLIDAARRSPSLTHYAILAAYEGAVDPQDDDRGRFPDAETRALALADLLYAAATTLDVDIDKLVRQLAPTLGYGSYIRARRRKGFGVIEGFVCEEPFSGEVAIELPTADAGAIYLEPSDWTFEVLDPPGHWVDSRDHAPMHGGI